MGFGFAVVVVGFDVVGEAVVDVTGFAVVLTAVAVVDVGCVVDVACDVDVVTELMVVCADCDVPLLPHPTSARLTTTRPPLVMSRPTLRSCAIPDLFVVIGTTVIVVTSDDSAQVYRTRTAF